MRHERDIRVECHGALRTPKSQQTARAIQIIIYRTKTAPWNLLLQVFHVFKIFVAKSFQAITFHGNKKTKHCFPIKTANNRLDHIINEIDDTTLQEELHSCQRVPVASQPEKARHVLFNYAIENINSTAMDKELDLFSDKLVCATKVNFVFVFVLKNEEDGRSSQIYAQEIKMRGAPMTELKDLPNTLNIMEICGREKMHTKWRQYKLINLTKFAVLRKEEPMGCNDALLHKCVVKTFEIICPAFDESTKEP